MRKLIAVSIVAISGAVLAPVADASTVIPVVNVAAPVNTIGAPNLVDGLLYTSMTSNYDHTVAFPYVEFDFGSVQYATFMKVANYIRAEDYYNNRGWKDVTVSYSLSAAGNDFVSLGTKTFVRGYDGINGFSAGNLDANADFQSTIPLDVYAQRIRFDVINTYGPATAPFTQGQEWAVSEVQFVNVPEPTTLAGLGIVLGGLTLRRRRLDH